MIKWYEWSSICYFIVLSLTKLYTIINKSLKNCLQVLQKQYVLQQFKNIEHLRSKLTEYIKRWGGKVKLYRNNRREGLIRARIIGAQKSQAKQGRVLIYLDAHCECGYNWLPPLLIPIMKNRLEVSVSFCLVLLLFFIFSVWTNC